MPIRYIPVVRTKAGEADALGNLTQQAAGRIFPLIRLTGSVPSTFLPKMINSCAGFPVALDGVYNFAVTGGSLIYNALFQGLGAGGVPVIPLIGFRADPAYNTAAAALANTFAPGIVVDVPLADLPSVLGWVTAAGWNPGDVDLLIDIGGVGEQNPLLFGPFVAQVINATLTAAHPWRSVTLHAWSAPKDHGPLNNGRNVVPRRDWLTWMQIRQAVPFDLDYSDSAHVHPSLDEVPGYAMANATVSVRYAVDDNWIVYKGVRTTGPNGIPMATQYRGHAQALRAEPQFGGLQAPCWGDTRIVHYATTTAGAGGRAQWAALLLNRHMSLVADRLP